MFAVVITEKGGAQRRMEFDKNEVTIGRVQGNDIILPKGNVSKRHSRIVLKDSRFIVVDLKSTNGTYVNGRKITSPLVVKPGDKVYIGDFILTVEDLGAQAEAPPVEDARRGPPPLRSNPPPAPSAPVPPAAPSAGPPPLGGPSGPPSQPYAAPPSQASMAPASVAPSQAPMAPPAPQPALAPQPAPAPQPQPAPQPAKPTPAVAAPVEPATRQAPPGYGPPPAVAPAPTGLRAVMSALRGAFPALVDADAMGSDDGRRWAEAKAAIARVMGELAGQGAVDANDTRLAGAALREAVGLGALEALLGDEDIQEIVVEGPSKVLVDRGQGLVPSEASFSSAAMLTVIARRLVARGPTSPEGPVLTGVLPEGGQVTVMLPPVAPGGPVIEVRRGGGPTIEAFVARGVLSTEGASVLRVAVEEGKTVAVVGPADADVSALVAALAALVDPSDRVVAVSRGATSPIDLPHVVHLCASGLGLGELALQAARLHADHLFVDGAADGSTFDALAALASHGGGGFLGANVASVQDPGASLVFLATLSGRAADTAAQLVARAVQVVVHVVRHTDGPKVAGVVEVTGAQDGQVTTQALVSG